MGPAANQGKPTRRRTSRAVRVADVTSRVFITGGGIATIGAVLLICAFLVAVVVPLFRAAQTDAQAVRPVPAGTPTEGVLEMGLDEHGLLAWQYLVGGSVRILDRDGEVWTPIRTERPFGDGAPSAASFDLATGIAVFGFGDGAIRQARIGFAARYLSDDAPPEGLGSLGVGQAAPWEGGVVQRTPSGQLRVQEFRLELGEPLERDTRGAVVAVDVLSSSSGTVLAALGADGVLASYQIRTRKDLRTGKTTTRLAPSVVPFEPPPGSRGLPQLMLSGQGNVLWLVWPDGLAARYFQDPERGWVLAERLDLVEEPEHRITARAFLVGRSSLVVGDDTGRLRVWFPARPAEGPDRESPDGLRTVAGHELRLRGSPVTALGPADASRLLAVGQADGTVSVFHVTSQRLLVELPGSGEPVALLRLSPRADELVALGPSTIRTCRLDPAHAEVTLGSLFRPVWYEGHVGPEHVWQSTGGTNAFEPKLGLMPLVFGTLKATLYSLLIGVPIALLAALFTSEFLSPKTKTPVKSVIEMMAGLPSVVLGFLAALVIAPFVQGTLPAVLLSFFLLPGSLLLGAHLWQLLPQRLTLRLGASGRVAAIAVALAGAVALSALLGPSVESLFFGFDADGEWKADVQTWLDSPGRGSATGGWLLLLVPCCGLATLLFMVRWGRPWLQGISGRWSRGACAAADLARFAVGSVLTVGAALLLAALLGAAGLDPRGSVIDTYVQRNALVVGFVMGFAIIPIVYTLSEDALSSVPGYLREGSLGAGATPWQTAIRIIAPTAMSGLFSAVMIGLGRAIGETMIVLMAAGNTPIMEWNAFNGFRTLSANIAVEMPEAVEGDTHYRTLFLTALLLFLLTLVVNTVAEAVRQRFRKRAFQL